MTKDKDKLTQKDVQSIWDRIQSGDIKREKSKKISKYSDPKKKKGWRSK
jgi:hypothetical protein